MATKVQRADLARNNHPPAAAGEQFFDALAKRVAAEVLERIDARGGLGQGVPRVGVGPDEWGKAWDMSGAKVRQLVKRGLPHVRIGAQTRIQLDSPEVLGWLREHGDYLDSED